MKWLSIVIYLLLEFFFHVMAIEIKKYGISGKKKISMLPGL